MRSVLSYFKNYFEPGQSADYRYHSAGWIAQQLYNVLSQYGPVEYIDGEERPTGLKADLMVGHFWNFAAQCTNNHFKHRIAVYSIANPDWTRKILHPLADEHSVPFPHWDFPPPGFDNQQTLSSAEQILLIGNRSIAQTFPHVAQQKIHRINYSVDTQHFNSGELKRRPHGFCYVATQCDLRKGFMDVLKTWQKLGLEQANLQVVGSMSEVWQQKFKQMNSGNIHYRGWVDSSSQQYLDILRSCRFAYIPSYSEGQMGTLLEAIFCGCIPITTHMSGLDERVLKHCLVIKPGHIKHQRKQILEAASWPYEKWLNQVSKVYQSASRYQTAKYFNTHMRQLIEKHVLRRKELATT